MNLQSSLSIHLALFLGLGSRAPVVRKDRIGPHSCVHNVGCFLFCLTSISPTALGATGIRMGVNSILLHQQSFLIVSVATVIFVTIVSVEMAAAGLSFFIEEEQEEEEEERSCSKHFDVEYFMCEIGSLDVTVQ